jgi:diguanylate cyclase (GGDEF)-like protein
MHLGITEANTPDGRYFIGLVRDLTKEEELLGQVQKLATHDSLTGLPNRLQSWNHLEERYALPGKPVPFTLFYCDLDGFKAVNDSLGHAAGDTTLIEAAKRLREEVFVRDFVGRLGGDEFLIIVDGTLTDAEAFALGNRVIRALKPAIATPFGEVQIGVSIGYAHVSNYPESIEALMHAADQAMYLAKRCGKGQVFTLPKIEQ